SHDVAVVENLGQDRRPAADLVASMQPRRCRRGERVGQGQPGQAGSASMQPRRCRRGEPPISGSIGPPATSFNGATTLPSWRTQVPRPLLPGVVLLQCSHDVAVVENKARALILAHYGPLQCSHDVAVVENTWFGDRPIDVPQGLQCSHDVAVVENARTS